MSVVTQVWWTILAAVVIVAGGVGLHVAFPASGGNSVVAIVAPVNESPWEHLKMPYWPTLVVIALHGALTPTPGSALLVGQTVGFYVTAVVMVCLSRTADDASVAQHAAVYVLAVALGQTAATLVMSSRPAFWAAALGAALLLAPAAAFAFATFRPPHRVLFRDPLTDHYGIPVRR
jgi:hypothetical protein